MSNYEELNRIYGEAETEFIYDSFSLPHTANAPGKEMGSTVNDVTHNVKERTYVLNIWEQNQNKLNYLE